MDLGDDVPFFATVRDALGLIERLDLRRFRRIELVCRFIINAELTSLGQFDAGVGACKIDFGRLRVHRERFGQEWLAACVATVLVHEATHGYLRHLGLDYDVNRRKREERLCTKEEHRFAARLDERVRQLHPLVHEFDERRWHPYWHGSWWDHIRASIARLRESSRSAKARAGKPWVADEQDGDSGTAEHGV